MIRLLLQTICAFVIGILSLLGAHRLYLLWRDRDLDVPREIREAVEDLRNEAETRLRQPLTPKADPGAHNSRSGHSAPRDVQENRPEGDEAERKDRTSPTEEARAERRQPELDDILARLSRAKDTCEQEPDQ